MQKTLGGDRLGSGKKMTVNLHGYERSTHDMGYLWRSTMSAGTLVPFMVEVALPGDTFDINLDCDIKTHPTIGPLFGSYKVQLDVFQAPLRLYQGELHNNKLGIGMNMANVKLPQMTLFIDKNAVIDVDNPDNAQINPSCLLSYLGIRGIGTVSNAEALDQVPREFNAVPLLMYWDVWKNYYANKSETLGFTIHTQSFTPVTTIDTITIGGIIIPTGVGTVQQLVNQNDNIDIEFTGATPNLNQVIINTNQGQFILDAIMGNQNIVGATIVGNYSNYQSLIIQSWNYISNEDLPISAPVPWSFTLDSIDNMRELILQATGTLGGAPFDVNAAQFSPYSALLDWDNGLSPYLNTQEGLALKTYQSDLFNNWINTELIDGTNGINEITAIDTSAGSFNLDTLNLSKKVYDMLNRIAVSGGSYDDWLDAVYTNERYTRCETPIYHGGLIKELVFQEVISNSSTTGLTDQGTQPLGTLGGRGILANKHKGGHITIKVDEPSYLMGIVSLTPRIDYSQGNKWDTHLLTMDDLHKPGLDEIGFQDLITEQMAWWTTRKTLAGPYVQKSAGKQPAWINYMTNVNQTRGNFAIPSNEMFMTLNRRYEMWAGQWDIEDLTTYIDPSKFNHSFAETSIDAQNFWTQISVDITARRKMSAKIMPNL